MVCQSKFESLCDDVLLYCSELWVSTSVCMSPNIIVYCTRHRSYLSLLSGSLAVGMIKICKMGHALRAVQPYISQVKQPDLSLINIVRFSTLFFLLF